MSQRKDLTASFHDALKRHRGGRRQAGKLLGRMRKAATGPALREALRHAQRDAEADALDPVFAASGKSPRGASCDVTESLASVVKAMIGDLHGGPALDDGLAAEAAALEGLAVGRLAMLKAWAGRLGLAEALPVLDRLRAEAELSRDRLAAFVGERGAASPLDAGSALTPKQAALIGLR